MPGLDKTQMNREAHLGKKVWAVKKNHYQLQGWLFDPNALRINPSSRAHTHTHTHTPLTARTYTFSVCQLRPSLQCTDVSLIDAIAGTKKDAMCMAQQPHSSDFHRWLLDASRTKPLPHGPHVNHGKMGRKGWAGKKTLEPCQSSTSKCLCDGEAVAWYFVQQLSRESQDPPNCPQHYPQAPPTDSDTAMHS